MDISAHRGGHDIPMPIISSYSHANMIHEAPPHNHIILSPTSAPPLSSNGPISSDDTISIKKAVKYRECLKNHAASMGGNAMDGCGEFMPSGEEGTLEALKCSACNCHRNFHRKEIEGEAPNSYIDCFHLKGGRKVVGQKGVLIAGSDVFSSYPAGSIVPRPHPQMIMPYNLCSVPSESDEQEGVMARPPPVKKRYRTKFTPEQKEKMLSFAEKVGWKMQKQEEDVVQQFCQEIGIKRRVLKVWMHNNKHNLAKTASPTLILN